MIEKFAGYGFNKSHSTAYALIAYMTAYLKAHYPVEFMAALLSSDIPGRNFKKKDSLVEHLEDCQRMNIEVVPPDVNRSRADFTVADGKIHFGLSAIKGCGGGGGRRDRRRARRKTGRFTSLFDFCERVDPGTVNRTADRNADQGRRVRLARRHGGRSCSPCSIGRCSRAPRRPPTAAAARRACSATTRTRTPAAAAASLPDVPEWDERDKLAKEKEVLGFYLTSHPLAEHEETLDHLLLAHDRRGGRADAPHRSDARRHARGDQVLAHEEPQAGQARAATPCSTWRTRTASCAASSGPSSSPSSASWSSPTRSSSSAARSTSGPAARKPT